MKTTCTIAFDTETYLIAPGRLAPKLVCLTYYDGTTGTHHILDSTEPDRVHATVRRWLTGPYLLVGHNVAFDLGVVVQAFPDLLPLVFDAYDQERILDTGIGRMLVNIARGFHRFDPTIGRPPRYSLAELVEAYFGEAVEGKTGDSWRFRYHELDGVPSREWPAEARRYAVDDAVLTARVFNRLKVEGAPADWAAQCRAHWALHLMGAWGIRTDARAVNDLEARLKDAIESAMGPLREAGIYRPSGSQNKKVVQERVAAAFEAMGMPVPETDKGNVKTDAETLKASGDPLLKQLADIAADQKELSAFIPVLHEGTKLPINPRWRTLVATGRTACSKPNLQNQPRRPGVRECFVPRPGNVFISADYSVAELRALAQVLLWSYGESEMAKALIAGDDLHVVTAAGILGITYEEAERRRAAGDKAVKEARQLAKAANFGFPGGLGAPAFVDFAKASYGLELTEDAARTLKEEWMGRYPEMRLYFQDIGNATSAAGGRFQAQQYVSGRLRGDCGFTDGCNTYFQGLVADGAKRALYLTARECYTPACRIKGCDGTATGHVDPDAELTVACPGRSPLYGFRPVAFVHDEIIIEGPEARAHEAAKRLEAVMAAAMRVYTPDIPVLVEAALMRRWDKDAAPVTGPDGRLIPWEDRNDRQAA